jgi:5-(carboxyamino)imidazole ribonucleotide mutase
LSLKLDLNLSLNRYTQRELVERSNNKAIRKAMKASGDKRGPLVGVVGGSRTDFPFLEQAVAVLKALGVPSELLVVSAHRTPDRLFAYAEQAPSRGIEVIVAGAGGAAHLPGMLAAKTHLPVIGVPIPTENLRGLDSLLSIVQMPKGIPVATVAIGGGENAGLLAAQILAGKYPDIQQRVIEFRAEQTRAAVASSPESSQQTTSR